MDEETTTELQPGGTVTITAPEASAPETHPAPVVVAPVIVMPQAPPPDPQPEIDRMSMLEQRVDSLSQTVGDALGRMERQQEAEAISDLQEAEAVEIVEVPPMEPEPPQEVTHRRQWWHSLFA